MGRGAAGGVFYGKNVFDPGLTCMQIALVQLLFYAALGLIVGIISWCAGRGASLDDIFDLSRIGLDPNAQSVELLAAYPANAFVSGYLASLVVERARKCLDYTFTAHLIHLVLCVRHAGWPSEWLPWVVLGGSLVVMAIVAEYACVKREMREIPIRYSRLDSAA